MHFLLDELPRRLNPRLDWKHLIVEGRFVLHTCTVVTKTGCNNNLINPTTPYLRLCYVLRVSTTTRR